MQIKKLLSESVEGIPLYRAINDDDLPTGTIVTNRVRTDRQPMDSWPLGAAIFDYSIEQALGEPNIRQRALFAHTNAFAASGYGNLILKLQLAPTTSVIFNPNICDSVSLTSMEEAEEDCLLEFISTVAEERSKVTKMRPDHERRVLNGSADNAWYFDKRPVPVKFKELVTEWTNGFENQAEWIDMGMECLRIITEYNGRGYVKTTVNQLPTPPVHGYEVMIYGIPEYQGEVVNIFGDEDD